MIKNKEVEFKASQIKESRLKALEKIKELLSVDNVDAQFDAITGAYHSSDKFIVTWNSNWNGIPSEFAIDKCDSFSAAYSGYKAIYVTRSLFHEKQLGGYSSIERALSEVGMKLCSKAEKVEFYEKFAVKYNERLKLEREAKLKS